MTETPKPRLLVLDDWEGLVRAAPGTERLRERCTVTVLDRPVPDVDDSELADDLDRRLDPGNLPDADVVPSDGVIGGVRRSSE